MFYGKPKSIKRFDGGGTLLDESTFEYEATLAFENGALRPSWEGSAKDYPYQDYTESLSARPTSGAFTVDWTGGIEGAYLFDIQAVAILTSDPWKHNSYFVKTKKQINRKFEATCSKASGGGVLTPNPDIPDVIYGRKPNPNGPGYNNNHKNANKAGLLVMIENETADENLTTNALVASSPLEEEVLLALFDRQELFEKTQLEEILLAQERLSDAVLQRMLDRSYVLSSKFIASILSTQPYLTDILLLEVVENDVLKTDAKNALLMSQGTLNNTVLLAIIEQAVFNSPVDLQQLLLSQTELDPVVIEAMIANVSVLFDSEEESHSDSESGSGNNQLNFEEYVALNETMVMAVLTKQVYTTSPNLMLLASMQNYYANALIEEAFRLSLIHI